MTLVVTTFQVSCRAKILRKCEAELHSIVSELRNGDFDTGVSHYLPDADQMLTFVTPWPEVFDFDEDWAMDPDAEQEIMDRLLAIDPTVQVLSWEPIGELDLSERRSDLK